MAGTFRATSQVGICRMIMLLSVLPETHLSHITEPLYCALQIIYNWNRKEDKVSKLLNCAVPKRSTKQYVFKIRKGNGDTTIVVWEFGIAEPNNRIVPHEIRRYTCLNAKSFEHFYPTENCCFTVS